MSRVRWIAAAALVLAAACSERPPARIELPVPADLDGLARDVRDQYQSYRADLDRLLEGADASPADLAQAYGRLGTWYDLYDATERAILAYEQAIALDPQAVRWSYYLGHIHREEGRLDQARSAFERVLALDATYVPVLVWLGEVELAAGRAEAASAWFAWALERDPPNARARLGLGRAALVEQDFTAALAELERARELDPLATEIHHALGLAARGAGDAERAERHLRLAQVQKAERVPVRFDDPLLAELLSERRDFHTINKRAKALLAEGQADAAIAELERLVAQDPDTADWRNNLALALHAAGRTDEATRELETVLAREPDHPQARFGRAVLRAEAGDLAGAEHDYRAALAGDPDYLEARSNLAELLQRTGRTAEAVEHLEEAVRLDPADPIARYRRAQALVALGRWQRARNALEEDLESLREPAEPLRVLLGRVLASAGDERARDAQRGISLAASDFRRTGNLAYAESLAMSLAAADRFAEAVAWQQACLDAAVAAGDRSAEGWIGRRLVLYRGHERPKNGWESDERLTRLVVQAPPGGAVSSEELE